jgi:uncharacterized repeat protein (TIGR01451 family)
LNNEGYGKRTFIPPFLAYVDPVLGETAADNRYVAVVGDDAMPDMHLGRFPVTSLAELAAMVDKTIAYETNPAPGAWRMRAVFVADNPDNAGHFDQLSDVVADHLPPEFVAHKIYLGTTAYPVSQAARAQQATLDAFNQGALLFNYVGHSSISNWAGEFLFGVNTLPQVANGSLYPIMLPMTCLEGSFHNPRFPSLGESVVRLYGRGALASWSPTGLGVASGHDYLHRGFYDAVFNRGVVLLGPATTAGKLNLFVNARFPNGALRFEDLLETYVLFGDPTTRIGLPLAQLSVTGAGPTGPLALGDPVTYTLSYGNFGQVQVQNVALTLTLPGAMTSVAWASSDPTLVRQSSAALSWRQRTDHGHGSCRLGYWRRRSAVQRHDVYRRSLARNRLQRQSRRPLHRNAPARRSAHQAGHAGRQPDSARRARHFHPGVPELWPWRIQRHQPDTAHAGAAGRCAGRAERRGRDAASRRRLCLGRRASS